MYLFLGRFEQINHLGLVILNSIVLLVNKIKGGHQIQDSVHSKKNLLVVMYLFLGRFEQIKPFWTCHTPFYYIIDRKIKDARKIQDSARLRGVAD
jgi:hypothetical protein